MWDRITWNGCLQSVFLVLGPNQGVLKGLRMMLCFQLFWLIHGLYMLDHSATLKSKTCRFRWTFVFRYYCTVVFYRLFSCGSQK